MRTYARTRGRAFVPDELVTSAPEDGLSKEINGKKAQIEFSSLTCNRLTESCTLPAAQQLLSVLMDQTGQPWY